MDVRIQIVAIVAAAGLIVVLLELVRRRRLLERYALLWLFSALVLLGLAVWRDLLGWVASALGVAYPPNALFLIAFGFVLGAAAVHPHSPYRASPTNPRCSHNGSPYSRSASAVVRSRSRPGKTRVGARAGSFDQGLSGP